ncbi:MAG: hypothetical protein ACYCXK_02140 [Candidatus Humimicrobiaceae bacterium]
MEKKYKVILGFFIMAFLSLTLSSCSLSDSGNTGEESFTGQSISDETTSSFDLTGALNTLKEKLVNPPMITSHKPYQEFTSAYGKELVIIRGKSDIDTSITLKVNGLTSDKKYAVDSNGDFEIKDGVEIVEGSNTVEIYAVRADGEKSEPTKLTFLLNTKKDLDFSVYENISNLIEISSQFYSREFKPQVYVRGIALPDVDVYLKVNDKILGQTIASDTGSFSFENVLLSHGVNTVSVWYVSGDGSPSAREDKVITVFKDAVSPNPSSLTGYVGSGGNHLGWAQSTDAGFIAYKIVRVEDPVKNPHYPDDNVIATITDKNNTSYTDTDIIPGKAYFYTLWTLDNAGNLISSNVLPLPAPKYMISMKKLPSLQDNVLARREWYYEYFEITNTGNVPVNIQPILVWFLLEPDSDPAMALNPLWAAYIWDPDTGIYYYSNEDIKESQISDWIARGSTERSETVTYSSDGLTKTTTILEIYKIAEETVGNRIVSFDRTTTIIVEDLVSGTSTTTTAHEISKGIAKPEEIGSVIEGLQPGEKIKLAVKISNVAADNGDKIVVHFHFAPTDSSGAYFTDDIVSTHDIFITSSGK